jgi:hypothetical protein
MRRESAIILRAFGGHSNSSFLMQALRGRGPLAPGYPPDAPPARALVDQDLHAKAQSRLEGVREVEYEGALRPSVAARSAT